MPFASGSLLQLRYIPEVTPGVTPGSGNMVNLRTTGPSFKFNLGYETSKEIRSDRATSGMTLVSADASGGLGLELSFKEYDPFIEAVLQGTWGTAANISQSCSVAVATDATIAAASGTPFSTLTVGQYVSISGFSNAKNNGIHRIKTITGGGLGFTVDAAEGLVVEASKAITVKSTRLSNGVNQRHFSIEEAYTDITQFRVFRGMSPSKMSLSFQSGQMVSGSFDFMGYSSAIGATTFLPGTPVASQTGEQMNAVVGLGVVYEGGAPLSGVSFKSLSLDIDNALRGQDAIGVLGYAGIASGTLAVTGSAQVYFANANLYNKFVNNQSSSLAWAVQDGAGTGYGFTLPNVKFNEGNITGGSINSDLMVDISFTALLDAASGKVIMIDRAG